MSAGGYGHVPVPLLYQREYPSEVQLAVEERQYLISYVGSLGHAPEQMRQIMHRKLQIASKNKNFTYHYHYGDDWRDIMRLSKFSLTPRGFGRSAYHIMESLQMGLIPVYVYLDTPWVPYEHIFETFGLISKISELDQLIEKILTMSNEEIEQREQLIRNLMETHFLPGGIMRHMHRFMLGKSNDLVCRKLPPSDLSK